MAEVSRKHADKVQYSFEDIITDSERMKELFRKAKLAAETSSSIMVYGETGTGKEMLIQAIHNHSSRRYDPFIAQNCAAIPSNLLEAILFGTVKGSYTGSKERKGLFELAAGGTLYLDELNSMPLELQAKLLRVLDESRIRRIGGSEAFAVNVRIIASLNEEPKEVIQSGKLREDLFYRINTVSFFIPPLRKRKEDICLLTEYFIQVFNSEFKADIRGMDNEAKLRLQIYDWPGNVRELKHTVEAIFNIKKSGLISVYDLEMVNSGAASAGIKTLKQRLEEVEKEYIVDALRLVNYNTTRAAGILGIPRQTLQYKMSKLNIGQKNSSD